VLICLVAVVAVGSLWNFIPPPPRGQATITGKVNDGETRLQAKPTIWLIANPSVIPEDGTVVITAVVKKADRTPAVGVTVHFKRRGQKGEFDRDPPDVVTDADGMSTIKWTNTTPQMGHGLTDRLLIVASATVEGQLIEDTICVWVELWCKRCH